MIVFVAWDWKQGTLRHRAKRVELCRGEQGIPCGFELTARCGATSEQQAGFDLESDVLDDVADCPSCFAK